MAAVDPRDRALVPGLAGHRRRCSPSTVADDTPLALVDRNLVFACSAAARADGVKRGLRIREAQSRCTHLQVLPYDPVLDARAFEPVLAAIEEITARRPARPPGHLRAPRPGSQPLLRQRRERAAAELLRCLEGLGIPVRGWGSPTDRSPPSRRRASTGHDAHPHRPGGTVAGLPRTSAGRAAPPGGADAAVPATRHPHPRRPRGARHHRCARAVRRAGRPRATLLASGLDSAAVVPRTPPKQLDRVDRVRTAARPHRPGDVRVPGDGRHVRRRTHEGGTGVHIHPHRGD